MSSWLQAVVLSDVILQSRGVGAVEALQDALPRWGLETFAAVTHLGDSAVLLALAFLAYLAYDRRDGAFVLGVLLVGFAVTVVTKSWFGLPRPPMELQYIPETGLGFPSGHALGATAAWGSLAVALDRISTASRRGFVAGVVVLAVSLSRVVIGVHYLVDVVAGVAVGIVVLAVAVRWLRDEPLSLFGLGGGISVFAVVVSGGLIESFALLGGTLGASTAWQVVEPAAQPYGRQGLLAIGGLGVLLAGSLAVLDPRSAVAFAGAGVIAMGVLLAPLARQRWFPA